MKRPLRRTPDSSRAPVLVHLTTTDVSLELLLGPQLEAFSEAGYEVIGVSAPGPYVAAIERRAVRFIPLRNATRAMAPGRDLLALVELIRLFRRLRPDIVHTHNPKPGLYGRVAARLARVPVVVNTQHGLYATEEDRPAKRRIVYGLERVASMFSDAELAQNPEDLDTLRRIGVNPSKLRLLGNGVDLTRFDPAAVDPAEVARVRAELAGEESIEDLVLCGVVGRLVWEKGLREVFDAAKLLRDTHPHLRIVVIGPLDPAKPDGLGPSDLTRITEDYGVRFAGERSDMETVYAALDLFALASYREGFPRAAMEASAMGVPVIATDIRGCRQVVEDGRTGRLVPVRDAAALACAIGALVDDPTTSRRMGDAARDRAAVNFDQAQVIATTLRTYRDLGRDVRPDR